MTDNEIVKALGCCCETKHSKYDCMRIRCPYFNISLCKEHLMKDALDLIHRQKTEIFGLESRLEGSQAANEILKEKIESLEVSLQSMRNVANGYKSAYERAEGKRKTAIQDFAERLKEVIPNYIGYDDSHLHEAINNLVKEMGGMDFTQMFMNVKKLEPMPDIDLQAIMEGKQCPEATKIKSKRRKTQRL